MSNIINDVQLDKANNLSDLTSVSTAVTNLGATSTATASALVVRDSSAGVAISDASTIVNASDTTKKIGFNVSGATTGHKATLSFSPSANQTITFPNATLGDTVCLLGQTQRLSNKSFYNTGLAFVDNNNLAQISINTNAANASSNTALTLSAGSGGTVTLPTGTVTLAGLDTVQTLTNKSMDGLANTFTNLPPIGSLAYGTTVPDATYLKANGQVLSQASYTALFSKIGILPSFTNTTKTVTSNSLIDVAYSPTIGGGLYVAIGSSGQAIWTSPDTLNWNANNTAGVLLATPTSIAWFSGAGGMFVMCGAQTYACTSVDGTTWLTSLIGADALVSFVACSSTTIVVGGASDADNGIQNVWTSTDGVSWTKRQLLGAAAGKTITALNYSSGLSLFFAGCSDGNIITSPDGITWTLRTSGVGSQINQFASSGSLVVAVGAGGVITTSPTGVTWTVKTQQTGASLNGVAYSPTATIPWYAIGTGIQMTSADGLAWVTSCSLTPGKRNIIYSSTDSQYVICGSNGFLATTPDLITFTGRVSALPTTAFNAGAYGVNGGTHAYVIVGAITGGNGAIQTSTDSGVTWTSYNSGVGNNVLNDVVYFSAVSLWVACGAGGRVTSSPDGAAWTAPAALAGSPAFLALAFNGSILVVVGAAGNIFSSTDGTSWTSRLATSSTTTQLNSVAWNGTIFCAVGNTGVVVTSTDGITWTKQSPIGPLNNANWLWITSDGVGNFYAQKGNFYIFVSTDGINWTPYYTPSTGFSVNWMNGKLVAYSNGEGSIITSTTGGQTWTTTTRGNQGRNSNIWNKLYWSLPSSQYMLTGNGGSSSGGFYSSVNGQVIAGIGFQACLTTLYAPAPQSKLVALGISGCGMVSTDNGLTFTPITSQPLSAESDNMSYMAYSPSLDLFVAVSNVGIWYSSNGTVWTQAAYTTPYLGNTPGASLGHIVWAAAPALFVIVGGAGTILTSTNGTTWTTVVLNVGQAINSVCYNTALGLFVAGGNNGLFFTSTNGTSWTKRLAKVTLEGFFIVQTLESLGFVAVTTGAIGTTMYSSDGITWVLNPGVLNVALNANGSVSLYSSVDNGVFFLGPSFVVFTNDGQTFQTISTFTPTLNTRWGITYIPATDTYAVVAGPSDTSGWLTLMTRSYNKNTQFVLPTLQNTWIKALP